MSTVKISQLSEITHLNPNTSNTLIVGVDIPTGVTGKITATTLAHGLYTHNSLNVGNNEILFPDTIGQFSGNSSGYLQVNLQNFDANGTADYIVTADKGNDITSYIDMGITNSQYDNSNPVNGLGTSIDRLSGYLYVKGNTAGGNLVVGVIDPNREIRFISGGLNSENVVYKISNTGITLLNNSNIVFSDGSVQSVAASPASYTQQAYNKANSSVSLYGHTPYSILFANSSGHLSNTNALSFNSSNNTISTYGLNVTKLQLSDTIISLGLNAGLQSQGSESVAIGHDAGQYSQGSDSVAIGYVSGQTHQGSDSVAVGSGSGYTYQGLGSVAIGSGSGSSMQGETSVAIGFHTASSYQGSGSVAIGESTALYHQGNNSISIGYNTGFERQGSGSVAIGESTALYHQGNNSISIGSYAGASEQGSESVAIGTGAGNDTQRQGSVAIGYQAGNVYQSSNSVAIGAGAGNDTQRQDSVAIGRFAGEVYQSSNSVAIGHQAGNVYQSSNSVAIGYHAGFVNQGQYSIALGYSAGRYNQQQNSIIINASGQELNSSNSGLYIDPVRDDIANTSNIVFYNVLSKELTYAKSPYLANTTGIFNGSLDIAGTANVSGGRLIVANSSYNTANAALVSITGSPGGVTQPPPQPGYMLDITGLNGIPSRVVNNAYGANTFALFGGRKANGTAASPTAVANNDVISRFGSSGHNGTSFVIGGQSRIDFVAAENYTTANNGSRIEFWNTPVGSNTINKIATFNGNSAEFSGVISPQKGIIYTPNVISSNVSTLNIDVSNNSIYKVSCNTDFSISLNKFQAGKIVEVWLTHHGNNNDTITHGCIAGNATKAGTTFNVNVPTLIYLKYFSVDGDLANTYVSINYG